MKTLGERLPTQAPGKVWDTPALPLLKSATEREEAVARAEEPTTPPAVPTAQRHRNRRNNVSTLSCVASFPDPRESWLL